MRYRCLIIELIIITGITVSKYYLNFFSYFTIKRRCRNDWYKYFSRLLRTIHAEIKQKYFLWYDPLLKRIDAVIFFYAEICHMLKIISLDNIILKTHVGGNLYGYIWLKFAWKMFILGIPVRSMASPIEWRHNGLSQLFGTILYSAIIYTIFPWVIKFYLSLCPDYGRNNRGLNGFCSVSSYC